MAGSLMAVQGKDRSVEKQCLQGVFNPMRGDYMTCWEMYGSGVAIGMIRTIIRIPRLITRRVPLQAKNAFCAAVPGSTTAGAAGHPPGSGSSTHRTWITVLVFVPSAGCAGLNSGLLPLTPFKSLFSKGGRGNKGGLRLLHTID